MLRIQRTTQLLIVLCACALVSGLLSLAVFRTLELTALHGFSDDVTQDIRRLDDMPTLRNVCATFIDGSFEIREHGTFLARWGLSFVCTWAVIIGLIAVHLYRQLCATEIPANDRPKENIVDLAMQGKLELWKAFWGLYVGSFLLSATIIGGPMMVLINSGIVESSRLLSVVALPILVSVPAVAYFASAFIVWRCAKNTPRKLWRYLARLVVIAFTVLPTMKAVTMVSILLAR